MSTPKSMRGCQAGWRMCSCWRWQGSVSLVLVVLALGTTSFGCTGAEVVSVASVAQLKAALSRPEVTEILVTQDMQVHAENWPASYVPRVAEGKSVSITGPCSHDPSSWPLIDLQYTPSRISVAPNATLAFRCLYLAKIRLQYAGSAFGE